MDHVCAWLHKHLSPSLAYLNAARLSLGVIKPLELTYRFHNPASVDVSQGFLFGDIVDIFGPEAARFTPYLRFRDEDGWHELQLREWGCYEWMRKEPDKVEQLWDNLALTSSDHEHLLLVGNMCYHRNVWLIINTFRSRMQRELFPLFADGQSLMPQPDSDGAAP
jgi:hypothetical protein